MEFLVNKGGKKSQIFMFDLILSSVILIVSIGLVFSFFIHQTQNKNIYDLSNSVLNGFTQTKINTINSHEVRNMFIAGEIRNIQNTVAQQVGAFYYQSNFSLAKNLSKDFLRDYVSSQFNFQVILDNNTINYTLYSALSIPNLSFDNSSISTQVSRIVFGFFNSSTIYGPYTIIIRVWQ